MIARSVTIVAPIVNEWQAPKPLLVMFGFTLIALITSVTFPNELTEEELQEKEKRYNPLPSREEDSDITYHDLLNAS